MSFLINVNAEDNVLVFSYSNLGEQSLRKTQHLTDRKCEQYYATSCTEQNWL